MNSDGKGNDGGVLDLDKIIQADAEKKRERKKERDRAKKLTVRDYVEMLRRDPLLAQRSRARLHEMVCGSNNERVKEIPEEERFGGVERSYEFIAQHIFGADRSIAELVVCLEAGKRGGPLGKKMPYLVGPPGSGKSDLVKLLFRGLEEYRERKIYFLSGCAMFDDPILALPRYLREEFERKLGISIKGDLCPHCLQRMQTEFTDEDGSIRWAEMPIEIFTFSKQGVRGLTKFGPTEDKAFDMQRLTGIEDPAYRADPVKDPNNTGAYVLSAKIPKANRGICLAEDVAAGSIDVFKLFLSIGEEEEFEIYGSTLPHVSIDVTVIATSNISSFKKFAANKDYEGMHDRFYLIKFPYVLRIQDEVKIYRKLIQADKNFVAMRNCHIAPDSLELAALFAVLTRLTEATNRKISLLAKAKIYNGDSPLEDSKEGEIVPISAEELLAEGSRPEVDISKHEGMFGVGPRNMMAALNSEVVKQLSGKKCLTPLGTIKAIKNLFKEGHVVGCSLEEIQKFLGFLEDDKAVMLEYKTSTVGGVQGAYLESNGALVRQFFNNYVENVQIFRLATRSKYASGLTTKVARDAAGTPRKADEKFMRSIEKHIGEGLSEEEAKRYRGEILEGGSPTFESSHTLRRAVEKKLLEDSGAHLQAILMANRQDRQVEEKIREEAKGLFGSLITGHGFCKVCAAEALEQTSKFLCE